MGTFNFDAAIDRTAGDSVKWDRSVIAALGGNPDAVPFWVADMDFAPPAEVLQALRERAAEQTFGYPVLLPGLRPVIADWLFERHRWKSDPEHIVLVPGLMAGLAAALDLFSEIDDGVVLQTPAYHPFFTIIENNGRRIIRNPLLRQNSGRPTVIPGADVDSSEIAGTRKASFALDFEDLERAVTREGAKILLFCSPHNPAGRVWKTEEIVRTADLCRSAGIAVLSDEIHADLVLPPRRHKPFGAAAPDIPGMTFMAPSKTFNIPGEKIAFTVIHDEATRKRYLRRLEGLSLAHLSIFAPAAALAAYRSGKAWLDGLIDYLQGNLGLLRNFLETCIPELVLIEPEASFIAFIDCSRLKPLLAGCSPARFFSTEADVLLHDGAWFGPEGSDYVRINFGTRRSLLEAALHRMLAAVERVRAGERTENRNPESKS